LRNALLLLPLLLAAAPSAPSFSAPTAITNPWAPFVPGAMKAFRGHADGARLLHVESYLSDTRSFDWNGGAVLTRVLEERDFVAGALSELSWSYLAQDDAGNVQLFGEVSWSCVNGQPTTAEEDSWLVGGAKLPGDPPAAHDVTAPAMFMLAAPKAGDSFSQPAWPSGLETTIVQAAGLVMKVPSGTYTQVLKLQELDDGEDGGKPQHEWIAPGIGIVRHEGGHEKSELFATSLVEAAP
jgi:hypothetical protein